MIHDMRQNRHPKTIAGAEDPCPLCGRSTAPYDQRASDLLDTVLLLEAVLADLKKVAEEAVL